MFLSRLRPDRTIDEVWNQCITDMPESLPSQHQVVQLLSQLHHSNLLFFRSSADGEAIFERFQKTKNKELIQYLMAFMYFKVPIWNPDNFLNRWRGFFSPLFSKVAGLVWLAVIAYAVFLLASDWQRVSDSTPVCWLGVTCLVIRGYVRAEVNPRNGPCDRV